MAPPTLTYNNASASHTKVELSRTGGIASVERHIANSMIARDISNFNTGINSIDQSFLHTKETGYNLIAGTTGGIQLTHLMINNQEDELGTVFAFAAVNEPGTGGTHTSFLNSTGLIDTDLNTNATSTVTLDQQSNPYYDSTLVFTTDNTLSTFYDNSLTNSTGSTIEVEYDNSSSNFNAEKAVNSRYNVNSLVDPLTIKEHTTFNTSYALFTDHILTRDTTTGELVPASTGMAGSVKTVANSSNELYYDVTLGLTGQNSTNDNVFFGCIKGYQGSAGVTITGDSVVSSPTGTTTTGLVSDRNNVATPIYIDIASWTTEEERIINTATAVNNLFSTDEQPQIGGEYYLNVSSVAGGGYTFNYNVTGMTGFTGMSLDDDSLSRNIAYMSACSSEGNNFQSSEHTLEIANGYLTKVSSNSTENAGLLGAPRDEIETLPQGAHTSPFIIRSYFTQPNSNQPNSNIPGSFMRSTGVTGITPNYTNLKVVYDHTVPNETATFTSDLPSDKRTTYNVNYLIETKFPASIAGQSFNGANYISNSQGFSSVFQTGKSGVNVNSDYTFSSEFGVTGSHTTYLNDNEVAIIQLNNALYLMSEENTLFSALDTTNPISNTRTVVIGENIDLSQYSNADDNTKSDLRIKLTNKTLGDLQTELPADWSFEYTNAVNNLITDLSTVNLFGNDIYDITAVKTNTVGMTVSAITNGLASNYDALDLGVSIGWTWNSVPKSKLLDASNVTFTPVGSKTTSVDNTAPTVALVTGANAPSGTVGNLLESYKVNKYTEVQDYTFSIKFPIGEYSNLGLKSGTFTVTSVYYALDHKTQSGVRLSDNYLNYFRLGTSTGSRLNASRTISSNYSATFNLYAKDLYGFNAIVQYRNSNGTSDSNWTDASSSFDLDLANNNETRDIELTNGGFLSVAVDLSKQVSTASNVMGNIDTGNTFYIGLTTSDLSISYTVSAKKYNPTIDSDFDTLSSWTNMGNSSLPVGGSILVPSDSDSTKTSLYAIITNTPGANLTEQPSVKLEIKDKDGNNWATFDTINKNATSSFNIIRCMRPLFQITETYGDSSITTHIIKKQSEMTTQLSASAGIELTFAPDTTNTDYKQYRLRGDYVYANLYDGTSVSSSYVYGGPYNGVPGEVKPSSGLNVTELVSSSYKCRGIDIQQYRGNSIKASMFTNPSTAFEEFRWNRTPTYVSLKVRNYGVTPAVTYQETSYEVYKDLSHTVTSLGSLGNLGLIVRHNYSRYISSDLMSIPINVTTGSYKVRVINPLGNGLTGTGLLTETNAQKEFIDGQNIITGGTEISASNYLIIDFVPFNIVASRVKITSNTNLFTIQYGLPDLQLFYLNEYEGDPSTFSWSDVQEFVRYGQDSLKLGVNLPVPGTETDINPTNSIITLKRNPDYVQAHTFYFILPRPQYIINAVGTNQVSSLPHSASSTIQRYFDAYYNSDHVGEKPFIGSRGVVNSQRVVNDMTVKFTDGQLYVNTRGSASSFVNRIYIPSNILNIDLYSGENHSSASSSNLIARIFSNNIHKISDASENSFYDNVHEITTYLSGEINTSNKSYKLLFTQPISVISPSTTNELIYGTLGNQVFNITLNDIRPFLNITSYSHIDLKSGSNTKLYLYGHSYNVVNNDLVARIVRYESARGLDLTNEYSPIIEIATRNLGFTAVSKKYRDITICNASIQLTDTPFNLQSRIAEFLAAGGIGAPNSNWESQWLTDPAFTQPTVLDFNFSCLSTVGQTILQGLVSVSDKSPYKVLVSQYNPIFQIASADGSPIYVVTPWGTLKALKTHTKVVQISSNSINNSSNITIPSELLSYNILDGFSL